METVSVPQTTQVANKSNIIFCLLLSLFWVIFCWGFWEHGVNVFGINAFIYSGAFLVYLIILLKNNGKFKKSSYLWIIPISLMLLSFAIFENPFFKIFNFLVFPVLLAFFYNYNWAGQNEKLQWRSKFFSEIVGSIFALLAKFGNAFGNIFNFFTFANTSKKILIRRILFGIVALVLALMIILPLLSSADSVFKEKLDLLFDMIDEIFSFTTVGKIIIFILLSSFSLAAIIAWAVPKEVIQTEEEKNFDDIIVGIVLFGVLFFYLVFIWVQIDRLWIGSLPIDFLQTEKLVKSGFWQLLFLSFINLLVFMIAYKKTGQIVQKLLGFFTFASLLLLASSAHRMMLYVQYYGFSYEKFYASYTVLFCAVLFIWMISRLFINKKSNITKFAAFLFLWMFGLVAIFPVEQFIVRSNVVLSKRPDSQIRLFEMTMLSGDVLGIVKEYKKTGLLEEKVGYLSRDRNADAERVFDWQPWIEKQQNKLFEKRLYELSLSGIINR